MSGFLLMSKIFSLSWDCSETSLTQSCLTFSWGTRRKGFLPNLLKYSFCLTSNNGIIVVVFISINFELLHIFLMKKSLIFKVKYIITTVNTKIFLKALMIYLNFKPLFFSGLFKNLQGAQFQKTRQRFCSRCKVPFVADFTDFDTFCDRFYRIKYYLWQMLWLSYHFM